MKLLHIDTSILVKHSVSKKLTAAVVQKYQAIYPEIKIISHDLTLTSLEHLTNSEFLAWQGIEPYSENIKNLVSINDKYLKEFLDADIIVIGAPMYNLTIPSQLKAWLDRIAVAGKTFRYTENGPEGLVKDKKVLIASTRGGIYSEDSSFSALDFQEKYLKEFFKFIGLIDVTFLRAEGLAYGEDIKITAIDNALNQIQNIK